MTNPVVRIQIHDRTGGKTVHVASLTCLMDPEDVLRSIQRAIPKMLQVVCKRRRGKNSKPAIVDQVDVPKGEE